MALYPDYNRSNGSGGDGVGNTPGFVGPPGVGGGGDGGAASRMTNNGQQQYFGPPGGSDASSGGGYPINVNERMRMMQGGVGGGYDPSFDYYYGGMGGGGYDPRMSYGMGQNNMGHSYGGVMSGPMGMGPAGGGGRNNPVKVDNTMGGFDYSSRNGAGNDRRSSMYGSGYGGNGGRGFEGGVMGGRGRGMHNDYDAMMMNDRMMMERSGGGGAVGGGGGYGNFGPDEYDMMMMDYEMFERQQRQQHQQQRGGGFDGTGGYGGGHRGRMGP